MVIAPAKLLAAYDAGNMTRHELLLLLEQAAVRVPPAEIAAGLPSDVLDELRERSNFPPASPDNCRVYSIGSYVGSFDWEADMREQAHLLFEGKWRWHRYFHQI